MMGAEKQIVSRENERSENSWKFYVILLIFTIGKLNRILFASFEAINKQCESHTEYNNIIGDILCNINIIQYVKTVFVGMKNIKKKTLNRKFNICGIQCIDRDFEIKITIRRLLSLSYRRLLFPCNRTIARDYDYGSAFSEES